MKWTMLQLTVEIHTCIDTYIHRYTQTCTVSDSNNVNARSRQIDCQPQSVSVCVQLLVFISDSYIYILWVYLLLPNTVHPWQARGKWMFRYLCVQDGGKEQQEKGDQKTEGWFILFIWFSPFSEVCVLDRGEYVRGGLIERWRKKAGIERRKIEKLTERKVAEKMSFI